MGQRSIFTSRGQKTEKETERGLEQDSAATTTPILLPLVKSYFPKFPPNLSKSHPQLKLSPLYTQWQRQWPWGWGLQGGGGREQSISNPQYPHHFHTSYWYEVGHMIAANCLDGGKCGLVLASHIPAYSSRAKERESFNKHETQILVSLTKPSPALTFLYITCLCC